ncbi:hypothetical protein [Nocardiopsis sp. CNT312]|uniref:hypothetical protein n=1 Tax=Nocardiopsis sp. CNT312 TaxID=1137268 RepID=UPI0004AF97EC|nr:hypothetical protein [Nocardiopsis sp. CNT312]
MPRSREQTPRVPYMSLPPSMRRRRLEEHHRRRVSEETRWALLSVLLLVTGLSAAVFAGAWALENRALDTRSDTTTAQAVWFIGENQYVWYERDGVWRVDPALSDTSYPHGTAVTVEVVPGSDPLVAIEGVRHPSGEAAVAAVSCLVLGTAVYLLDSKASTGRFRLFRRRGLVQLGRGLLMPIHFHAVWVALSPNSRSGAPAPCGSGTRLSTGGGESRGTGVGSGVITRHRPSWGHPSHG